MEHKASVVASNLQTLISPSSEENVVLSGERRSLDINNESSRTVKICYFAYKFLIVFFTLIGLLILLFLKDLVEGDHKMLNILREIRSVVALAETNNSSSF